MLTLIKRLFRSRDQEATGDRRIFVFWDGSAWQRADPLTVGRALEKACPKYEEHLRTLAGTKAKLPPGPLADDLKAQQDAATAEIVAATRTAFGIEPLSSDKGLTEAETIHVLASYLRFMAESAESARPH